MSAYGKSFGGGGWISRFGRPIAASLSDRRMTGTDVDGRRAGGFFGATGGGGGGVNFLTVTGLG